ncbi:MULTISPECIES: hypothetical protein [unclassified Synechocystis]|uniref:hypothetical protein n=1 Tax=unclassified Synechocystis TaxID=2640012 RepID=UPI001CB76A9E|nr:MULTISPECIES: hypothetical protein [unclassified Synechocystis]
MGDSPWPQNKPEEKYKQLSLLKLTPTVTPSSSTTGPRVKIKLRWPLPEVRRRRSRGQGSGYIRLYYCEKQTRSGKKSYEQYYYHYELELKGKRVKRSAYIPKDKLDMVQEWDRKKVDVILILQYLGKATD